jgi:pimeloyl-ACP methyl ester carboxylesterase
VKTSGTNNIDSRFRGNDSNNLLLLHGALGAKTQFAELENLLSENFNVHSINFSGHGGSEIPRAPFSIEMFAGDILKWRDENNINKINIFGYSMGGYAALHLAKTHTEITGKIFTLATKFEWTEQTAAREVKMLDPAKIKEKVPAFAIELEERHSPQNWETILAKTAEMMINLGESGGKKGGYPLQTDSILNEVMIGIGEKDKMVTVGESETVCRSLVNGKLFVFPGTPHPLEQVDAEMLADEIKKFFN